MVKNVNAQNFLLDFLVEHALLIAVLIFTAELPIRLDGPIDHFVEGLELIFQHIAIEVFLLLVAIIH